MPLDISKLSNKFLLTHLDYVDATEPPKLFHIWSALTCASACFQRHLYMDTGFGRVFGNMYVLLIGPPGTRKNTAIKFAFNIMNQAVDIRLAPDDTGGQRQGLIASLVENDKDAVDGGDVADAMDLANIGSMEMVVSKLNGVNKHVTFALATEFGCFIGQNNLELLRFFIKLWDGENYTYRLKAGTMVLSEPLMGILGGSTPDDMATLMPPQAIGGGLMSRFILAYAPHKAKRVAPSDVKLAHDLEPYLTSVYANICDNMAGNMVMSQAASDVIDKLYALDTHIEDTRFIYYTERRLTHLMKMTMILAATRGDMTMQDSDVVEAHRILEATEEHMPDALGEFGLSPVAVSRQKMLEYLRHAKEPISQRVLWAVMQRDMKLVDFSNSLSALVNGDKIAAIDMESGRAYMYKDDVVKAVQALDDDALDALLQDRSKINVSIH